MVIEPNLLDVPTVNSVEEIVGRVEQEPWYWFPVRHHSPHTAFFLQQAILERRPKLILIEGPSESNELIPVLQDSKTRPPVAIYSCYEDSDNLLGLAGVLSADQNIAPRWACWFPFLDYSPELVAIRTASKIKSTTRFIDLPHYGRLQREFPATPESAAVDNESNPGDSNVNEAERNRNFQTEQLLAESNFYQSLAEAGGYKSWDEGWDALFEFRDFGSYEAFRHELLTFCAAARLTSVPSGPKHEETLERERFMMRCIRNEIQQAGVDDDEVMIVCGGFHTALDRNDATPPPDLPTGQVYTTLVPYSYFQVSDISGYGAGNRAPRFYQSRWDTVNGKVKNPLAQYIVSVLQAARKKGENLSAADSISISQHARMLATIRGREYPILDDMHDAIITCCCKGNPDEQGITLQRVIDQIDIGNRIGKIPDSAPRLPIVDDFYREVERLKLDDLLREEKLKNIELDKRESIGLERSALFHRLSFTDIPFAKLESSQQSEFESGLIFRERWALKWSPTVEAKLIERNLLGDTLEGAATNQLKKFLVEETGNAGVICRNLVAAMQMQLPHIADQIFGLALTAIEEDSRFLSLADAVVQLRIVDQVAIHREMRREKIEQMIARSFARCCFAIPDIVSAPDDHHAPIVDALTSLADLVLKSDQGSEFRQLFADAVRGAYTETVIPFLKGALLGILVEIKLESHQTVADEIRAYANSAQEKMINAGDFVHGVISVSRASLMAGAGELTEAIDQLIQNADWEVFVVCLPRLRAAMELLHQRHRDSLAARVAEIYGLKEAESLRQLDVNVALATEIAELDLQVAKIMSKWSIEP